MIEYDKDEVRTRRHRRVALPHEDDLLAFQRVVVLPLDLAIIHGAAQNFRLDLSVGYHPSSSVWVGLKDAYYEEASAHVHHAGFNLFPGYNDEPWIHVGAMSTFSSLNSRSSMLDEAYVLAFDRYPERLQAAGLFPDPRRHNNNLSIDTLLSEIKKLRCMH